jgi:hypothetical protein
VNDPSPDDEIANDDVQSFARRVVIRQVSSIQQANDEMEEDGIDVDAHLSDPMLDELRAVAESDSDYVELMAAISTGFRTPRNQTALGVRQYWSVREELSVDDGLVLFGRGIIIPRLARRELIRKLHAAHQGIVRMKRRARQTVFWPGSCGKTYLLRININLSKDKITVVKLEYWGNTSSAQLLPDLIKLIKKSIFLNQYL